jgi:hypothetical protein
LIEDDLMVRQALGQALAVENYKLFSQTSSALSALQH